MIRYISTKGGISPVDFDEAVLQGFAEDGGLFVPDSIPTISSKQLKEWSTLDYPSLAYEMLSLFIAPQVIPSDDLKQLIAESFADFTHPDLLPMVSPTENPHLHIMELFHGPTLSFKDIAMGFLVRTMDYFLQQKKQRINLILATTGDTGPAAAHACAERTTVDCWPLYPSGMISAEQERQMTTLTAANIHPVKVNCCADGGDDLDVVVAKIFADRSRKKALKLSSVNSINWCRVMVQTVHYAFGYFRACKHVGDPVIFSVPSGAFGNLCAGDVARQMGIPISFICANNQNKTLHTAFSTGIFRKRDLVQTVSSAIDIVVPYNFWRFLYFKTYFDSDTIRQLMEVFQKDGEVHLNKKQHDSIRKGFRSLAVSDEVTLTTIHHYFEKYGYLLDPHGAVAVAAADILSPVLDKNSPVVCLATAHPAKFPDISNRVLEWAENDEPPIQTTHPSLEAAKMLTEKKSTTTLTDLEQFLIEAIQPIANQTVN